ncbi:MAG: hypothetical protein AB7E70_20330 [Hyphomicrobiaceae bacterium]
MTTQISQQEAAAQGAADARLTLAEKESRAFYWKTIKQGWPGSSSVHLLDGLLLFVKYDGHEYTYTLGRSWADGGYINGRQVVSHVGSRASALALVATWFQPEVSW